LVKSFKVRHYPARTDYEAAERNPATAHMFIVNPLAGGAGKFFSTHPPTEQRVERLRKIGEEIGRPF